MKLKDKILLALQDLKNAKIRSVFAVLSLSLIFALAACLFSSLIAIPKALKEQADEHKLNDNRIYVNRITLAQAEEFITYPGTKDLDFYCVTGDGAVFLLTQLLKPGQTPDFSDGSIYYNEYYIYINEHYMGLPVEVNFLYGTAPDIQSENTIDGKFAVYVSTGYLAATEKENLRADLSFYLDEERVVCAKQWFENETALQTLIIKGIFESDDSIAYIPISAKMKLGENLYNKTVYLSLGFYVGEEWDALQILDDLRSKGFNAESTYENLLRANAKTIALVSAMLTALIVIVLLIAFSAIINFNNIQFDNKRFNIALNKALGCTNKNIAFINAIQTLIMLFLGSIIAIGFSFIFKSWLQNLLIDIFEIAAIKMVVYWWLAFVLFGVSALMSLMILWFFIKKIDKISLASVMEERE